MPRGCAVPPAALVALHKFINFVHSSDHNNATARCRSAAAPSCCIIEHRDAEGYIIYWQICTELLHYRASAIEPKLIASTPAQLCYSPCNHYLIPYCLPHTHPTLLQPLQPLIDPILLASHPCNHFMNPNCFPHTHHHCWIPYCLPHSHQTLLQPLQPLIDPILLASHPCNHFMNPNCFPHTHHHCWIPYCLPHSHQTLLQPPCTELLHYPALPPRAPRLRKHI